jgi:hypothetical protein
MKHSLTVNSRIILALIIVLSLTACTKKPIDLTVFPLEKEHYYFCDYNDDYKVILGSGDECTELWGVDFNYLELNKDNLSVINAIDFESLIKKCKFHAENSYELKDLVFDEFSISSIEKSYFIIISFIRDGVYTHMVPALPDGRIILSNNELEWMNRKFWKE